MNVYISQCIVNYSLNARNEVIDFYYVYANPS
jgi:hypothetical protein